MKKVLFLISLFFCVNIVYTQIPGYMGKRFALIYTTSFHTPVGFNGPKFGTHNAISAEYLLSKKIALGLSYKYFYLSGKNDYNFTSTFGNIKYKYQTHSYGPYTKLYVGRKLAPLNPYFRFGFSIHHSSFSDLYEEVSSNYWISDNKKMIDFSFNFGFGKNWILADNVLLGFEFLFTPAPYKSADNYGNGRDEFYKFNILSEIFRVSLNLGWLAF